MSPYDGTKQTISYLMRRFADAGIRPGSRHGQNFLIDLNLQRLIVDRAQIGSADVVLEVGTGTGSLTALMAPRAGAVLTVEIDSRLFQLAGEELHAAANVVMLNVDALAGKHHLNPRLIAAVEELLAADSHRQLKLVANLPYSVATPLIANLLLSPILPSSMTVTVQKEVADRITARAGSKDYGALSVWIQSQCAVELVRTLPPSVFWPRPQVTSAVIHLEIDHPRRAALGDLAFFHDFVRSLFFHRRKFLRSVLASALKGQADKTAVDAILLHAALAPDCRAEQLEIPQILTLCHSVRAGLAQESVS
jgi:16S rRNA (adenine1518-N6/adenine1519-N6)-dimethyltransferase